MFHFNRCIKVDSSFSGFDPNLSRHHITQKGAAVKSRVYVVLHIPKTLTYGIVCSMSDICDNLGVAMVLEEGIPVILIIWSISMIRYWWKRKIMFDIIIFRFLALPCILQCTVLLVITCT